MAKKQKPPQAETIEKLSFEDSLEQLEQIVGQLEEGQIGLNEAIERYEQGAKHLKHCRRLLERAEQKIELLSGVDAEGNAVAEPFDEEEIPLEKKAEARGRRRSAPAGAAQETEAEDDADVDLPGRLF